MASAQYDILIVGGGQAARRAAEGARAVSPYASIAILGEEPDAPYDRPPLSKAVLESGGDFSSCEVRSLGSYASDRIDLLLGRRARAIEPVTRTVTTEDGDRLGYRRLVLATGSRARTLDVPPRVAHAVTVLRTRSDAEHLAARLTRGARVVVIGAGFVGLEVASSAVARGAGVTTVLEAGDRALARALPKAVAERVVAFHRGAGVDVRFGARILGFGSGPHGAVTLETNGGSILADIVVVGVGVTPNVELAEMAGLDVDNGIVVAADGSTSRPDIFAAGEVARHPVVGADSPVRLESWQVAELQAEAAGRAAAGQAASHLAMPWFWSDQLGHNIQMLGHAREGAQLVRRDLADGAAAWFALGVDGKLTGVITLDAGREISVARRLMARNLAPCPEELADPSRPLRQLLT